MRAENLYSSELFFKSRRYAQANYDAWLILSAKHGLLLPGDVIAPYDCKLTTISRKERNALAERVREQAKVTLPTSVEIESLCGNEYDAILNHAGVRFKPLQKFALPIGKKLQALNVATDPNDYEALLDKMYRAVEPLFDRRRPLKELVEHEMPEAGVYLFFDGKERRLRNIAELRIVRVGTHGVAAGSKASLRQRLRTHFGTTTGIGNHRSSIFRLHTGRSLINAKLQPAIGSWGLPSPDQKKLKAEQVLEQAVSKYLAGLYVVIISVPGVSDKTNDRAYVEQNLIALVSNGCKPLDPPSYDWLGLKSAKAEIRKSGLWNVNHVEQQVDLEFLDILDQYVSVTLQKAGSTVPTDSYPPSHALKAVARIIHLEDYSPFSFAQRLQSIRRGR